MSIPEIQPRLMRWESAHCTTIERVTVTAVGFFAGLITFHGTEPVYYPIDSPPPLLPLLLPGLAVAGLYLLLTFVPYIQYKYVEVDASHLRVGCYAFCISVSLTRVRRASRYQATILFYFSPYPLRLTVFDRPEFKGMY